MSHRHGPETRAAGHDPSLPQGIARAPGRAVRRIDALFTIERATKRSAPEVRMMVRRSSLVRSWLSLSTGARLSREALGQTEMVRAFDYLLRRWPSFTRFLDEARPPHLAVPAAVPSRNHIGIDRGAFPGGAKRIGSGGEVNRVITFTSIHRASAGFCFS